MAIYIGALIPDRQLDESAFCKALSKVAMGLAINRTHPVQSTHPNLDLHFLLSGKEEQPGFEGMRMTAFDKNSNTLKIESSVPMKMIHSILAKKYVVAMMQDAIDGANEFFEEKQIAFQHEQYLHLINELDDHGQHFLH